MNIDGEELKGYELSTQVLAAPDLILFGNYGYTHSEITKYKFNPADVGNTAPYVPRFTSSVGLQYTPQLTGSLNGFFRMVYEWTGSQHWAPGNQFPRDTFALLNIRAGVKNWQGKWSAIAWVKNATDKRYLSEFVLGGFALPAVPRSAGITFRYRFF